MATEAEVQALRNQIARLIGEKVQLENRVIELERDRAEMAVEGLAAAAVRSLRSAEEAMAAEVPGTNFRVPELELTVRGYVAARDGAVLLRLPRPEVAVPPEHLGSIRMLAVEVPAASATTPSEQTERVPVPSPLITVLNDVRATFETWKPLVGRMAARDIAKRATELSNESHNLSSAAAQKALSGLSSAAVRFGRSFALFAGKKKAAPFQTSAHKLASLVKQPAKEPTSVAKAIRDLVQCLTSTKPKRSPKK
jgi:hypothetical protein